MLTWGWAVWGCSSGSPGNAAELAGMGMVLQRHQISTIWLHLLARDVTPWHIIKCCQMHEEVHGNDDVLQTSWDIRLAFVSLTLFREPGLGVPGDLKQSSA